MAAITLRCFHSLSSLTSTARWSAVAPLHPRRLRLRLRYASSGGGDVGQAKAEPFLVTTPLYYVNAPPHMGSAYTTIAADAIARFQRLMGKKVILITGTDEHGEKIATAATNNDRSPGEHCDEISKAYQDLWKELDISYDKFIRTTDTKHEQVVKEFYAEVLNKNDIYRADYEGLYCVNCEEYKDEKELLENACCPIHLKPCQLRKENNYFFALSKYQTALEEFFSQNPEFVQSAFRSNEDLVIILEAIRIISVALSPIHPRLCWRIYSQLNYSMEQFLMLNWSDTKWGGLKAGQVMADPVPVFARIETRTEVGGNADDKSQKKTKSKKTAPYCG